eukprot:6734639-Prymnesium_polylepis.1
MKLRETPLGQLDVPLARFRGLKAKLTEWYPLKKGDKPCGEVCLELSLAAAVPRSLADEEAEEDADFVRLSG